MNVTKALCLAPACTQLAFDFVSNLSPNYQKIDACTDFEELVCGGWRTHHDLRPDQGLVETYTVMGDEGTETLKRILEGPYSNTTSQLPLDKANFEKMQGAYTTCMDEATISKLGAQPIISILDEVAATFNNSTDLSKPITYLKWLDISSFVGITVSSDPKDPDMRVPRVAPMRNIGLATKAYYSDKTIASQYQAALSDVLKTVHPNSGAANSSSNLAAALVEFESQIARIMPEYVDLQDMTKTYNPMPLKDAAKLIPQFGLESVLVALAPTNYTVNQVIVDSPQFLSNLSTLLSQTPKEVVQTYFYWKTIQALEPAVIAPDLKPWTQLKNKLAGRDPDSVQERFRTCINHVDNSLGWILSRFYLEAKFSAKDRDLGNQIVSDLKQAYVKKFTELTWMDDEVKKAAIEKVRNINQKIGYPSESPNVTDPKSLSDYYFPALNLTTSFFNNMVATREFGVRRAWSTLGQPTNRKEWKMTSPTVNAYYSPNLNEIVFPAGIMQTPIFGGELPSYINYGGFGTVAGHEISHGFDNHGHLYDPRGRYQDWWNNSTLAAYDRRAGCFIDEFNNFNVVGSNGPIPIRGAQTQGENIADSAGISAAWAAWREHVRTAGPDQDLPGLQMFTQEQLFFVAFGNTWCSKATPASLTNRVLTDEHSPAVIRVKGTLMNSRGFREAFGCPVKEPTCELW